MQGLKKNNINNKLIKQFEFEKWSNTLILNSLKTLKEKDDRATLLFYFHIFYLAIVCGLAG
jgi:hypothetical protein